MQPISLSERILANVAWCREIAGAHEKRWFAFEHHDRGMISTRCGTLAACERGADATLICTAVNTNEAALAVMAALADMFDREPCNYAHGKTRRAAAAWCEAVERERAL